MHNFPALAESPGLRQELIPGMGMWGLGREGMAHTSALH